MSSTRSTLEKVSHHVAESMGVRDTFARPRLAPVPIPKDIGRRPMRGFGKLDIAQAIPDPNQPRTEMDADGLAFLAESIRSKGQLHPIHVRWSSESERWMIVSGERRWRAAQLAGLPTIDCFFHEQPLSPPQILELQLVENLLREDIKPVEEARAFHTLMKHHGWTGKQLSESLRIPASKVSRLLALLDLPTDIQAQVDTGQIAARTAYELTKIDNSDRQRQLAEDARSGKLTHAEATKVTRTRKPPTSVSKRSQAQRQVFYADNGWQVAVTSQSPGTYHDIEAALIQALEEVRLRIDNSVRL